MKKNLHFWDDEVFELIGELKTCDSLRAKEIEDYVLSLVQKNVIPWLVGKVDKNDIMAASGYVMFAVSKSLDSFYNNENSSSPQKRKNWLITITKTMTYEFLRDTGVIKHSLQNASSIQKAGIATSITPVDEYPEYNPNMSVDLFGMLDYRVDTGYTVLKYMKQLFMASSSIDTAIVNFVKLMVKMESQDNTCSRQAFNKYILAFNGKTYPQIKNFIVNTLRMILTSSVDEEILELARLFNSMIKEANLMEECFFYGVDNAKKLREYNSRARSKFLKEIQNSKEFKNGNASELYEYEMFNKVNIA